MKFGAARTLSTDFVRKDWLEENSVFQLKAHPSFAELASFQQGMFYVQDPSTLLAVKEMSPERGEAILDMCAAPGGKLTLIAQCVGNEARVIAQDTAADRLRLIEQNCARLGVTCVKTHLTKDATLDAGLPFDRILLDAPCSNTGVMRRRVDLRWRLTEEEIKRLEQMQLALLRRAALLLKPAGSLVYSTCSLEPEENKTVIESFLQEQPGFVCSRQRQLLPWIDGVDGAYVATLKRR